MKVAPVLIALGVISLAMVGYFQTSTEQVDAHFVSFMTQYEKNYMSEDEFNMRREIFNSNVEFINKHNAEGKSFTLGVNKFSDWTDEEYRTLLGYKKSA